MGKYREGVFREGRGGAVENGVVGSVPGLVSQSGSLSVRPLPECRSLQWPYACSHMFPSLEDTSHPKARHSPSASLFLTRHISPVSKTLLMPQKRSQI